MFRVLMSTASNIFLTLVISLYYFALQPWAILARSILIILTCVHSKATANKPKRVMTPPKSSGRLVKSIEWKTKRRITIEDRPTDTNLAKCDPQSKSPLYSTLPKELRDLIFAFACSQSPDYLHAYDANAYYYRPEHPARLKTHTSLLQTCRMIWLEANALPMQQAEHAFWFQRGPYDRHPDSGWRANVQNERNRYSRSFDWLRPRELRNVSHVRLFMQMFQAEQLAEARNMGVFFPLELLRRGFAPARLTVTIRSSDWQNWERDAGLSLSQEAVQRMLDSPHLACVKEFVLEFEIEGRKRDQLDAILQQIDGFEGRAKLSDPLGNDRNRACKFVPRKGPQPRHWKRSTRIDNKDHEAYKGMSELRLQVHTLVWKNVPCDLPEPPPEPAFPIDSTPRVSSIRTPGFMLPMRSPALIMRSRAQRERLRSEGWMDGRFPEKEDELWRESVRRAARWEQVGRERFEKMMGDLEAERMIGKWASEGSLLRFVDGGL